MSKSSELLRGNLLSILADSEFHSGEALGKTLGISRAAISNHIKVLSTLGLDIYSVTGRGYCLAQPLTLLNLEKITAQRGLSQSTDVEVLNVIGSTNQYLKEKSNDIKNGHACLAEAQTAGRGRHGRQWVSPFGASLYLSMYWSFAGGYQSVGGLSLAVGVAVASALKKIGITEVQLKWPNDIYAQGKKLAGILIEAEGQMGGPCQCVLGVGLNISMPANLVQIDQPWIDLAQIADEVPDRNMLAACLLDELVLALREFEQSGLQSFVPHWQSLDLFRDKEVKLIMGQKSVLGICRGIDASGALILETDNVRRAYFGGEISVRPA